MVERYTTDVPAIPDPNFESSNPERRSFLDEALVESEEMTDSLRSILGRMATEREEKIPIEYDYHTERFFEQSNAQTFIDKYAVYDNDGRLNMDLTSAKIGIPYNFNMTPGLFAQGEIVGLHDDRANEQLIEIHLNKEAMLHQVTFGHEIGHYFWSEVQGMSRDYRPEEAFCDYFGRRMALDREHLTTYDVIDEEAIINIMSRFRVGLGDAVIALMETGLLPTRVAIDSYNPKFSNLDYSEKVNRGIFCLHCIQVGGDYGCPDANQTTPLLDLTDRAWGSSIYSCLGEDLHDGAIMSALTKHYAANEKQLLLFRPGYLSNYILSQR